MISLAVSAAGWVGLLHPEITPPSNFHHLRDTTRGTAEQHIKEGKYAFRWTRLSCRKFRDNEVRLQLHALAYNLATFLRCIELPEEMAQWSLTSLQLKLIKIGARVVRHARAITFQLAEVAVTGPMVRAILAAIRRLRARPRCA